MSTLKLTRTGYDNLFIDEATSHEYALEKSRLRVIKDQVVHHLDLIYSCNAEGNAEFEYHTNDSAPLFFDIAPGKQRELDWFTLELGEIDGPRCELVLFAPRDVVFHRENIINTQPGSRCSLTGER